MPDSGAAGADRIDVHYVANLARLRLTDAEAQQFQGQLDDILDYINQIRQIDVSGVEPTAHATRVQNVFRKDQARPGLEREQVMANAPVHTADQFSVPKIVE